MFRLPQTLTETDFLKIIKAVKKPSTKTAFMLGFYQTLRISEIINLQKEDIDIQRGFLHIKQGKGSKDRDIPIMQPVKHSLRYLPVKCGVRALQRSFKRYVVKVLGRTDLHFHSLRHSGATFYLNEKKLDIRFIQQLLGHARLSTTQIYTHVTPDNLKHAFDNVWS